MRWSKTLTIGAAFALGYALPCISADAEPLLFSLTGPVNASFTLDSDPTPSFIKAGSFIGFEDVLVDFGSSSHDYTLYFQDGGDFQLSYEASGKGDSGPSYGFVGPQIYSGTQEDPHFAPGIFPLENDRLPELLTISDPAMSGVPEPASWTMMLSGFGLVGAGMRRRAVRMVEAV